jgi:hypothetical protein
LDGGPGSVIVQTYQTEIEVATKARKTLFTACSRVIVTSYKEVVVLASTGRNITKSKPDLRRRLVINRELRHLIARVEIVPLTLYNKSVSVR